MQKSTQKNLYLAVTASLGVFAMMPASANLSILDEDEDIIPGGSLSVPIPVDGIRWEADDLSSNSVTVSGHQGAVTASNGLANSATLGHDRVTGSHGGGASKNTWTFDENGFRDEIDDTPAGGLNVNKTTRTATVTTSTVQGGGSSTTVTQNATNYDIDADTRVRRNLQVDGMANLNGGMRVGAGTSVDMGGNRVQNVADGVSDFDAVNLRQLNNLDKKLTGKINETGAIAAAFAQLGQAQTPGKSTFGIAAGGQGSKAAVALGWSHRPVSMKPVVVKGSLGASGKTVAGGVGATWEF